MLTVLLVVVFLYIFSLFLVGTHVLVCRHFRGECNRLSDHYKGAYAEYGLKLFYGPAYITLVHRVIIHFKTMYDVWQMKRSTESKIKDLPRRKSELDQKTWNDYQLTLYLSYKAFGFNSHLLTKDPEILSLLEKKSHE